jgi:hypothetical protein
LPFLHIALAGTKLFEKMTTKIFACDRLGIAKGVVEVVT